MILVNRNSRVVLEVLRAELSPHPQLMDNVNFSVQFGEQVRHGNARLSHRDLLNPVFNETLEFTLADSSKMLLRLSSRGVVLGDAEILVMSSKCMAYITTRNKKILGAVYYSIKICQPSSVLQQRELLKHTRGAQSENYAGSGLNTHSNGSRSKLRDKSQELRPRQDRQIKSRPNIEPVHSPQLSEQLFSSYFQKKTSELHHRQTSDGPEMQMSIDPRDRQTLQKRKQLELELEETTKRLDETRSARKILSTKVKTLKREIHELQGTVTRPNNFEPESEDRQHLELLEQLQIVESYNRQLRRLLASVNSLI